MAPPRQLLSQLAIMRSGGKSISPETKRCSKNCPSGATGLAQQAAQVGWHRRAGQVKAISITFICLMLYQRCDQVTAILRGTDAWWRPSRHSSAGMAWQSLSADDPVARFEDDAQPTAMPAPGRMTLPRTCPQRLCADQRSLCQSGQTAISVEVASSSGASPTSMH